MYCRRVYEIRKTLRQIGSIYPVIETIMGHPRHRESQASYEAGKILDCFNVCLTIEYLESLLRDNDVCVALPGSLEKPRILEELHEKRLCRALVSAETATQVLLGLGLRPDIIVTDLDAEPDLLSLYANLDSIISIHVHGDNIHKVIEFLNNLKSDRILLTSQVDTLDCVIGPLGYTDGDRASIIPMMFNSSRIYLVGLDLSRPLGKRVSGGLTKILKINLSLIVTLYYATKLGYIVHESSHGILLVRL